jgi:GST-like protein
MGRASSNACFARILLKLYAPDRIAYATERYRKETLRLYGVLDRRLADTRYHASASGRDVSAIEW